MGLWADVRQSVARVGVANTLRIAWHKAGDLSFDLRHGMDTFREVPLADLAVRGPNVAHGSRYQATPVGPFRKLMRRYRFPAGSVFVDFGSGKGRTLLLAAEHDFTRLVGVEFSAELCAVARENLDRLRARRPRLPPVAIVQGDAAEYAFRDDETVLYFFHPFDDAVLRRVLARVAASLARAPRRAWLIYYYPVHLDVIADAAPAFREVGAHVFGGHRWVVYRADPPPPA